MNEPSQPERIGAGRYQVTGLLGSGSQAETLEALELATGRAVAVKRFHVRGAKSWKDVELAEREARVLSTLSHPSLPAYIEHFEEGGDLFLVMERISGESLASLRKRGARLSQGDVLRFLVEAGAVLEYLHSRVPPIIHRDIKPGNVIRRSDGSFALVDFGSVRDRLRPEGGSTVVGTFGYMAPEQFQGRAQPGSDVYAVGATALALLTGSEPEDLPHQGLRLDVGRALGRSIDPHLVRALTAMLDPDPDRRPTRIAPLVSAPSWQSAPGDARRDASQWSNYGEREARAAEHYAERQARAAEHHAEREARRAERHGERWHRREEKWRKREERRQMRRAGRPQVHVQGFAFFGFPWQPIAVAALYLARLGTWGLFRVFLPTLLSILSLFFGRGLLRAAHRCEAVGLAGDRGLRLAIAAVLRQLPWGRTGSDPWRAPEESSAPPESSSPAQRVRVDPDATGAGARVGVEPDDSDDADALHEPAPGKPASRARG